MKQLRARPRYEIGEKVIAEQNGFSITRWVTVKYVDIRFTKDGYEVTYSLVGPGYGLWNNVPEERLANYEELTSALGVLKTMKQVLTPKFAAWIPRLSGFVDDLIRSIEKRLEEHANADDAE